MDARAIVIAVMQKFGEKSVYIGWFMAILEGRHIVPPRTQATSISPVPLGLIYRLTRGSLTLFPLSGIQFGTHLPFSLYFRDGFCSESKDVKGNRDTEKIDICTKIGDYTRTRARTSDPPRTKKL